MTPLLITVVEGHTDTVIALVKAKANVNAMDNVRVR